MSIIRLAVDAHGGDHGCGVIVEGVISALRSSQKLFTVILCGRREEIEFQLGKTGAHSFYRDGNIEIVDADEEIFPEDVPALAWKKKANSPLVRAIALQKEGRASASLSAGDTRLIIGTSLFVLGRTEGVSRPALAAFLPTSEKQPTLVLDVGANLDCRAEHLVDFARIGSAYVSEQFGDKTPTVALLNVGGESFKGTGEVREAADRLAEFPGYIGFIEGNEVFSGKADVVVCDGFPGNVLLKTGEGFYTLLKKLIGDDSEMMVSIRDRLSVLNFENYGAVPLLGVQGIVYKAHGASSSRAMAVAIRAAVRAVEQRMLNAPPQ